MQRRTLRVGAAAATLVLFAVPAAAQVGGCNVCIFEGREWITCFAGSTACTTIREGSTLVQGPICEKVIQPQT